MVEQVTLFRAADGKTFPTHREAEFHEQKDTIRRNLHRIMDADPVCSFAPGVRNRVADLLLRNRLLFRSALFGEEVALPPKPEKAGLGTGHKVYPDLHDHKEDGPRGYAPPLDQNGKHF